LRDDFFRQLQPNLTVILGGGLYVSYRGGQVEFFELLYKYVRCYLIHEGEVAPNIVFRGEPIGFSISTDGDDLVLGHGTIEILLRIVRNAPENRDQFPPIGGAVMVGV